MMLEVQVLAWNMHNNVGVEDTKIQSKMTMWSPIKRSPHSYPAMENVI